ncbi:hypothetical protein TKK_0007692 [Trichogramma kaykai]|uniref:WD repeat-containing protein 55 homolog n=1 Tax=Trichogramma kaykai TaxID=54128 RepID=A0ABD2X7T2_9HYME
MSPNKSKLVNKENVKSEEEKKLDAFLFGENIYASDGEDSDTQPEAKAEKIDEDSSEEEDTDNYLEPKIEKVEDDESSEEEDSQSEPKAKRAKTEAAWHDENDDGLTVHEALKQQKRKLPKGRTEKTYEELLRKKLETVHKTPSWAQPDVVNKFEDEEVLKHSHHLVTKKSGTLPKDIIDILVLKNMNTETHNEGPFINSVQFHETSTVGLAAGSSGVFSLFQIKDGKRDVHTKIFTESFRNFPISTARFVDDGKAILMGCEKFGHCFQYDMMKDKINEIRLPSEVTNMKKFEVSPDGKIIAVIGKAGWIRLLSMKTKELIDSFNMNKECKSIAFSPDGSKLFSNGEGMEVYVWDLQSRSFNKKFHDDGTGATLAVSPNGQYLASGSKQGVVNVYKMQDILSNNKPQPVKILLNLQTSITALKFNPTSEILAFASSKKENAFKMLHMPTLTVFQNFPTRDTKMSMVQNISFSPGSGYMGIGNNRGCAQLYRLKHFKNY